MRVKQSTVRKVYPKRGHARTLNRVQKKQVKAIISRQLETKFVDQSSGYVQLDRGGLIACLTQIGQGDGASQRSGDQVTGVRIRFSPTVYYNSSAVTTNVQHTYRMVMLRWNQDDGAVPLNSLGLVFQFAGGAGDYRTVCSPYNFDAHKQKDFTILYDKKFSIGQTSPAHSPIISKKLRSKINFSGAASSGVGNIYIVVIADDATGAHSPDLQMQWVSRYTYTDA